MKNLKKILVISLAAVFFLLFALLLHGSAHDGLCACGREFSREDTRDYMIYDCLGCGRNYTDCVCDTCWCGDRLIRTETESGILITTCETCALPCEECVCRDRSYYDALKNVDQGVTGNEIPNPENGVITVLAVALPFILFLVSYATVYRRRSATRARKDRTPALERDLDRIDKETDATKRYLLAKNLEESNQHGDLRILSREGKVLCHRKNELLAEAMEEDWIRDAVNENLRHCRMMNDVGFAGSVETVDRLWDAEKKDFSADRNEICGETPGQSLIKWDTRAPAVALFESITPLNAERQSNLLYVASNITRFGRMVSEDRPLAPRKTDPAGEEALRQTLARILPYSNAEDLLALPDKVGHTFKAPANLPEEARIKRMGNRNRFPGGTDQ